MRDPFVAPPRDRKSARSPLCLGAPCRLALGGAGLQATNALLVLAPGATACGAEDAVPAGAFALSYPNATFNNGTNSSAATHLFPHWHSASMLVPFAKKSE